MLAAPSGISRLTQLDDAWRTTGAGAKHRAVRVGAERIRDVISNGPRVVSVRSLPLSTAPYPVKYAFRGAAITPLPFITFTHRCLLVQFFQGGELRNLLFNPTDIEAARKTPYFARLVEKLARFEPLLAKKFDTLEAQLAAHGLKNDDIDYIAFDHFHTQDLRGQLGTEDGRAPRFPNATLLAPRCEWDDWDHLHPMQRAWFIQDGKKGVRTEKIAFTDGDLQLGDGVMLLRTPGHTSGNQTLFVNTDSGVWGTSENGVCADAWTPADSKIAGIAAACKREDLDVVLNSNTPESGGDQYTSMILERTVVDRVKANPAFVQMMPSTEMTPSAITPGLRATWIHGEIVHGSVVKPGAKVRAA
jgi:glyoxylase-like metal-dependent hydrolase (beta-lactamase superfamily II)